MGVLVIFKLTPEQYREHQLRVGKELARREGKPVKVEVPREHDEQVAFVQWFRLKHPDVKIIAIPNGGSRHVVEAKRLKQEGVLPGVPDLFIPAWQLWIEMKRAKGGTFSQEQKEMISYLNRVGYICIVAKGCEDAIRQVEAFKAIS